MRSLKDFAGVGSVTLLHIHVVRPTEPDRKRTRQFPHRWHWPKWDDSVIKPFELTYSTTSLSIMDPAHSADFQIRASGTADCNAWGADCQSVITKGLFFVVGCESMGVGTGDKCLLNLLYLNYVRKPFAAELADSLKMSFLLRLALSRSLPFKICRSIVATVESSVKSLWSNDKRVC